MSKDNIFIDLSDKYGCLVIKFEFSGKVNYAWTGLCKSIENAKYMDALQEWHVPVEYLYAVISRFSAYSRSVVVSDRLRNVIDNEKLDNVVANYGNYVDIGLWIDWDDDLNVMTVKYSYNKEWRTLMRSINMADWVGDRKRWEIPYEGVYDANIKINKRIMSLKHHGTKMVYTKTSLFKERLQSVIENHTTGSVKEQDTRIVKGRITIGYDIDNDRITFNINHKNDKWLSICKSIDGGFFNKRTFCWEYDFEKCYKEVEDALVHIVDRFQGDHEIKYTDRYKNKIKESKIRKKIAPIDRSSEGYVQPSGVTRELYSFQKDGVNALINGKKFLGDEQGLGKTTQLIVYTKHLKDTDDIKKVLIVCPNSIKFSAWRNDIKSVCNEECAVVHGSKKQRLKAISSDAFFTVINYESVKEHVRLDKDKKNRDGTKRIYRNGDTDFPVYDVIILDEAQRIKDPKAKTTQAIFELRTTRKLAASGTPVVNRPSDLAMVMFWLKSDFIGVRYYKNLTHMYNSFMREFAEFETIKLKEMIDVEMPDGTIEQHNKVIRKVCGYRNLDVLREKYQSLAIRRLKKDVLKQLPDKVYQNHSIPLYKQQVLKYNEAIKEAELIISQQQFDVSNALCELTRCKQIAGGLEVFDEDPCSAKADYLIELLDDLNVEENKVLIFTSYSRVIDKILYPRLIKYNPLVITGNGDHKVGNARTRADIVDEFQQNDKRRIFIGTTGACKVGITLTAASTVIMYDLPWTPSDYDQVVDRAHRIGQKRSVLVLNLIAEDTVEEEIYKMIVEKRKLAEYLVEKSGGNRADAEKIISSIRRDDIKRIINFKKVA